MFSLGDGRPIAKTDERKPTILGIIDTDNYFLDDMCCSSHDEEYCEDEPCCDYCPAYFEEEDNRMRTYESKVPLIPIADMIARFIEYIAGPSGSGKSTMAANLANRFKIVYPNKPVYIFSRTDAKNDPAFAGLKPIQISIDESLIEDPIDITKEVTEQGCLLIFDDCTTIHNDKIKKEIEKLMADAMEVGRKLNCNMIITSHLVIPNEKKLARTLLNEMTVLTVFPRSGSAQQIRYALRQYFGLDNKQIDNILKLKSRWVRISKTYPQYVLFEHGAYIL